MDGRERVYYNVSASDQQRNIVRAHQSNERNALSMQKNTAHST
jgi:hypothetical protein